MSLFTKKIQNRCFISREYEGLNFRKVHVCIYHFKNSLIIHKENTKEITTVAVVLYVIKLHVYFPKT